MRLMKAKTRFSKEKSAAFLLFIGCWMMLFFNFPILSIFNVSGLVLGYPILYSYLFIIWLGFIGVLFFIVQETKKEQ